MLGWSVREGVCLRRKRMFPVCAWHCSGPSDIHFRLSFLILYSRVQSTRTRAPLLSEPTFVDTILLRALFDGPRYVVNLDVKLHPNLAHMALLESYQCVIMQYLHFRGFQKLSHSPEYTRTLHIDIASQIPKEYKAVLARDLPYAPSNAKIRRASPGGSIGKPRSIS